MPKKAIVVIVKNYPSLDSDTKSIFVKRQCLSFIKRGFVVLVISPQPFNSRSRLRNEKSIYRPHYISFSSRQIGFFNTRSLTHFSWLVSALIVALWLIFRSKKDNYHVKFIYGHFLAPSGLALSAITIITKIKSVCAIGESNFHEYYNYYSSSILRLLSSGVTHLCPNSPHLENALDKLYGGVRSRPNICLVPSGVDTEIFKEISSHTCKRHLALPQDKIIILSVGALIERKNTRRLISAFSMLPDNYHLILLGPGDRNELEKISNITIDIVTDQKELSLYYNACDIFAFVSLSEGMPNALIEAMACNANIVASSIDIHKSLLLNYPRKHMCDPTSVLSIHDALVLASSTLITTHNTTTKSSFPYSQEIRTNKILSLL